MLACFFYSNVLDLNSLVFRILSRVATMATLLYEMRGRNR